MNMNRQQWYDEHAACPECGTLKVKTNITSQPDGADFYDNISTAECEECEWAGMVKNLKPDPGKKPEAKAVRSPMEGDVVAGIKTADANGQTYVCVQDVVSAITSFNAKLNNCITDEQAKAFTTQICREIVKMFVSADLQHWAGKQAHMESLKKNSKDANPGDSKN